MKIPDTGDHSTFQSVRILEPITKEEEIKKKKKIVFLMVIFVEVVSPLLSLLLSFLQPSPSLSSSSSSDNKFTLCTVQNLRDGLKTTTITKTFTAFNQMSLIHTVAKCKKGQHECDGNTEKLMDSLVPNILCVLINGAFIVNTIPISSNSSVSCKRSSPVPTLQMVYLILPHLVNHSEAHCCGVHLQNCKDVKII